ncbi:rod-binding protein [Sphingomonas morindae]|uniref:Rod-binding protein n=1 Tax=Sphingomonas morindae TaxID=1541170 RepID=A0ABY4X534_9SPHN|nr:rod-binding protein [Sphingomonas morindae]USI72008.1 rod-binding protein [Sphingomonas morindae]
MIDGSSAPPPGPPAASTAAPPDRVRQTAREFEAVLLGQMFKPMMETVATNTGFDGGQAEEMMRGLLAEELGRAVAVRGGIGLAPAVADQIMKLQEGRGDGR